MVENYQTHPYPAFGGKQSGKNSLPQTPFLFARLLARPFFGGGGAIF